MKDQELLELAAKAAGVADLECGTFGLYRVIGVHDDGAKCMVEWNPLLDDGDAFRLATTLSICIKFHYCLDDAPIVSCGFTDDEDNWITLPNFPDPNKSTRRAIVEFAARIGSNYK